MRRLIIALALAGCGAPAEPKVSGEEATPPPAPTAVVPAPTTTADETPAETLPPAPWAEMSHEERLTHMQTVVLPKMKALFQEHDPEHFATFNCASCHGADGKARNFEMPSNDLPRLDPTQSFAAHEKAQPQMTAWMKNTVVPAMAEALGVKPFDPATQQGLGCFACHQKK